MFKIFCSHLSAPVSVNNTHLPPHSISFTHNASLATALLTPRTIGAISRVITELPNNFPHCANRRHNDIYIVKICPTILRDGLSSGGSYKFWVSSKSVRRFPRCVAGRNLSVALAIGDLKRNKMSTEIPPQINSSTTTGVTFQVICNSVFW